MVAYSHTSHSTGKGGWSTEVKLPQVRTKDHCWLDVSRMTSGCWVTCSLPSVVGMPSVVNIINLTHRWVGSMSERKIPGSNPA